MSRRSGLWRAGVAGSLVAACAGCAAAPSTYRTSAEKFVADDLFAVYQKVFRNISCTDLESTETGERITCTASADDHLDYLMTFTVVGDNNLELTAISPTDRDPSRSDSTPDSGPPDSAGPDSASPNSDGSAASEPTTTTPAVTTAPATTAAPAAPTATTAPGPTTTAPGPTTTTAPASTTTTAPGG